MAPRLAVAPSVSQVFSRTPMGFPDSSESGFGHLKALVLGVEVVVTKQMSGSVSDKAER